MTASNEGVVWCWMDSRGRIVTSAGPNAPYSDAEKYVPASALSALQAELDAVRAQLEDMTHKRNSLRFNHAALVAGVEGLASWLMEEAGSGYATGKPEIDNVTTAWASARMECADKLRALLAGRE